MSKKNNFLEALDLWNFLKDHPLVISNPGRHGSAQACFDIRNVEKLTAIKNEVLGEELWNLQEAHNDGRGISCVRGIAQDIKRGDLTGAYAAATTDWDKIAGYRNVAEWLKTNKIVPDDEHYYISSIAK